VNVTEESKLNTIAYLNKSSISLISDHDSHSMTQLPTQTPYLFVLESDDQVRSLLQYNLQNWGYRVMIAIDAADMMQRVQGIPARFDLILLNQNGQSIEALRTIGQQVRQSIDLNRTTPIIILAERYDEDLEGQDIQIGDNEYISYLEDGEQLKRLLQRLCPVR
jgi:DNA-binding response OmpR family regulator